MAGGTVGPLVSLGPHKTTSILIWYIHTKMYTYIHTYIYYSVCGIRYIAYGTWYVVIHNEGSLKDLIGIFLC